MITYDVLREIIKSVYYAKMQQGYDVEQMYEEFRDIPDSYDALFDFGRRLEKTPIRGGLALQGAERPG